MTDKRQATIGHEYPCFAGDGEAARMMRATDWAATPLGPVEGWPPGLCSIVATLLGSRQPMFLWWGASWCSSTTTPTSPALARASTRPPWASAGATAGPRSAHHRPADR